MPHLFYAELGVLMLTLLICLALALVSDAPLKELANPSVPENPAKAPWYFLGLQEMVAFSAFMGGIGIPMIVLLGLALIPYLDRETEGTGEWFGGPGGWPLVRSRRLRSRAPSHRSVRHPLRLAARVVPRHPAAGDHAINPATILTAVYALYSIWCIRRYQSSRAGALGCSPASSAGFLVLTIIGTYFRGPNWDFYWSPADWPKH
jgi:hypothetical protein